MSGRPRRSQQPREAKSKALLDLSGLLRQKSPVDDDLDLVAQTVEQSPPPPGYKFPYNEPTEPDMVSSRGREKFAHKGMMLLN